jgi:UDP-glucose 4-epimerase
MTTSEGILVTGGAGYIGSHAAFALHRQGYRVVVLDDLSKGHRAVVEEVLGLPLIVGDIADRLLLDRLLTEHRVVAAMHFAAFAEVGESVADPGRYYRNNVAGALTLLEALRDLGVKTFVFSSTAAVFGEPEADLLSEELPLRPVNPYGRSKAMVEQILEDFGRAHGLRSVSFRYFNAAGADPSGRLGEAHQPETHLIPLVLAAALGEREGVKIFGDDYPTPDGTCVRDFVHVADLAEAHVLGLRYLLEGGRSTAINLGNGQGFSVRQVIEAARRVTGVDISAQIGARRLGDPPRLVADSTRARQLLGWRPRYSDLEEIITHAWGWHSKAG